MDAVPYEPPGAHFWREQKHVFVHVGEGQFFDKYAAVWAAETNFAASHEVHKVFDKYAAVLAAETNFAASHEVHKVFDKYLQYDYVKTVQAASGVPRFLKPVCLEERGAPAAPIAV